MISREWGGLIDDMSFANLKSPDISPLDLTNRFGEMSFSNHVSIYFLKNGYDGEFINEGLIRTYPIDKTNEIVEYIKNTNNWSYIIENLSQLPPT